ncbi:MAG TPA: DinB family protein [Anaerolineae bacterium]|nr:DinB family protein [Anaerolineae bacterium]
MITDYIRTLYAYNAWANGQILDTAAPLDPAQLFAGGGASFDSIHATLVHTLGAQWLWLSRWQGVSPRAVLNPADFPDLGSIRARWEQVERDTQVFVDALDASSLGRIVEYTNTADQPNAYPLWQIMLHQVNHATQHRSEVALLLTQFGHSPGELDLLRYLELSRT